jgi:predicted helicase
LLEQTYRTWRQEAPFEFSSITVCSAHIRDTEDIHSDDLSIASTTSPEQLTERRHDLDGVGVAFSTTNRYR